MNAILVLSLVACGPWLPGQQANVAPQNSPASSWDKLSDAERIIKLGRILDEDNKQLQQLQAQVDDPASEYAQAEARFKRLDGRRSAALKQLKALEDAGKLEEAAKAAKDNAALQPDWQAAQDRFNLAIQERKILQETMSNLRQKIQQEQQYLARLQGPPADASGAGKRGTAETSGSAPGQAAATVAQVAVKQANAAAAPTTTPAAADTAAKHLSKDLSQALQEAHDRQAAADEARNRLQAINERLEVLRKGCELEQKLGETAGKRADQTQQEGAALRKELAERQAARPDGADLPRLAQKIADADQRMAKARAEQAASADQVRQMQASLATLEAKKTVVDREVQQKQAEADRAQRRVAELENPFSLTNMLAWAYRHGPRALLILAAMLLLSRGVNLAGRRIVYFMAHHGRRNTPEENESRAQTLVSVFRNAASLAVLGGGVLMLMDDLGIPIMPLLGGAAVVGLAVAFGAQNLIRDYFTGFMVLMEDQYGINDVVKIGSVSGMVEKISLRMTVLRDMSGVVHFIPHGTISTVSNLTHGWSHALFDIPVAATQDVDHVMAILIELGETLRKDPAFAPLILDGPEMLGVDELADKAVMLRFFFKTRPLKQWLVKREMLRRIKHRFDELGVESPFSYHPEPANHQTAAA
jgi:small-conductance mechanosensitive channel